VKFKLQVSVQEWRDSDLAAQNRITLSLDTTIVQHVDYPITLRYCSIRSTVAQQQEETDNNCKELSVGRKKPRQRWSWYFLKNFRKEAAKRIGTHSMTVTRYLLKGAIVIRVANARFG